MKDVTYFNMYSHINIKGLNSISQDFSEYYLRNHMEILSLKKKYDTFDYLINRNKSLKIKDRLSLKKIEEISGLSKSKYYRIHKEIKDKGITYWVYYYKKNSTKPINLRKSKIIDYSINSNNRGITKELIDIIREIRNNNPTYSKYKIYAILNRDHKELINKVIDYINNSRSDINNNSNSNNKKIVISISTIGRILNFLKANSLTNSYYPYKRDYDNKPVKRNFNNSYAKHWNFEEHFIGGDNINKKTLNNKTKLKKLNNLKKNNRFINNNNKIQLGELIQIDHMVINKNSLSIRQFSAIDPITRLTVSKSYSNANSKNAKEFLINDVLKQFPFKIKSIQVDGGSEFMKYFEEGCKEHNIELFVLPPRSPKYNGRIERFNRIVREELLSRKDLFNIVTNKGDYNLILEEFIKNYNNKRPHSALDFLSPMEYYEKVYGNEASFSQMC